MTSLVFLMVLTTIGIFTLRNAALEVMMSANNNKSTEAFEASEAIRTLSSQLIETHLHNRGWPKAVGGFVDDDRFGQQIPAGLTLAKNAAASAPRNWYDNSLTTLPSFNASDLARADVLYDRNITGNSVAGFKLQGSAVVKSLRVDIQAGSNAAMSSGYEGLGNGAAAGGGNMYFYVAAKGQDPSGQATRYTAAIFRYVIRD